jgi:hypothetical protein
MINGFFNPKTKILTHFIFQKHPQNIIDNFINSFMILKNHPKTRNQKSYKDYICFSWQFQGKKPTYVSSPHQNK